MSPSRSASRHAGRRAVRGRPPKDAPQLSRASIVQAALAEIEGHGLAGMSMRSVARRLGVDAKSLYNHVDNKEALLDAVAEHILATMVLPEPTGDLAADIRAFAQAFRGHAMAHPRATSLVLTRQTPSVGSLVPIEAALALLTNAGFAQADVVHLLRTLLATLIGMVLREADASPAFGVGSPEEIQRRRAILEASQLPHVTAAARYLARFDSDEEFSHMLEFIIEAIGVRVAGGNHKLA